MSASTCRVLNWSDACDPEPTSVRKMRRLAFASIALLSVFFVKAVTASADKDDLHVCVVGAGIAGASATHFLSQLSGVRVTVFERSASAGGRIGTVPLGNNTIVEAGASIIASRNRLMRHFTDLLGLQPLELGSKKATVGLWDGQSFRLRTSPNEALTALRLLWRYRVSLVRMRWLVGGLLDKFDALYPGEIGDVGAWPGAVNMRGLFESAEGLFELTQRTFGDSVRGRLSPFFVAEFASAISRANYNADAAGMNGLAGSISLAGSGGTLWAVRGGNVQVVRGLLARAGADMVTATDIARAEKRGDGYALVDREEGEWDCGAVVVAAPVELAGLELPPTSARVADVGRKFQRTVATFVHGRLNPATFGPDPPDSVLTVSAAAGEKVFSSVSVVHRFANGSRLFKVFSKESLSEGDLARIFMPGMQVERAYPWFAYPKFRPPEQFAPFELEAGGALFYTSPIESGGSAMEMSAISGANAAALVRKRFGLKVKEGGKPRPSPSMLKEDL